jgi:hypothetical protein
MDDMTFRVLLPTMIKALESYDFIQSARRFVSKKFIFLLLSYINGIQQTFEFSTKIAVFGKIVHQNLALISISYAFKKLPTFAPRRKFECGIILSF